MSGDWSLEWVSKKLYNLVNRTGEEAVDVTFSAHGPMVVGMFGQSNWTQSADVIGDGDGIQKVMAAGYGARANPPYILIEWTDPSGKQREQKVEIPHG